jgi:N-methylhydantoinase B
MPRAGAVHPINVARRLTLRALPRHRLRAAARHRGTRKARGGLGLFRRFLILKDGTNFAAYTDRVRLAPYGRFGGSDGSRTRIEIERDGRVIKVKSKDRVDLQAGDILTLYSSGGGGYGPTAECDPRLIAEDVTQGYVSPAAATQLYGWTGRT